MLEALGHIPKRRKNEFIAVIFFWFVSVAPDRTKYYFFAEHYHVECFPFR